jgi:anaerobic selenocysteine-containing dehydrogenase
MTIRSHDQYNTTIYGLNDRYRGVKGERKVIFMNDEDISQSGLQAHDWVDITGVHTDGASRKVHGFKVIPYDIPQGCAAAYFPETNALVPIDAVADKSHTPLSKYIIITLEKAVRKSVT